MVKISPKKQPRKYTGVLQFFHNFEHDPKGLNHCLSDGNYPYTIEHKDGKHIISSSIARGHGRGGEPQFFRFAKRVTGGYDMASGVKINNPTPQRVTRIRKNYTRITPKMPKLK